MHIAQCQAYVEYKGEEYFVQRSAVQKAQKCTSQKVSNKRAERGSSCFSSSQLHFFM